MLDEKIVKNLLLGLGCGILLWLIYFYNLGLPALLDSDETRYALMAKSMLHTKEFITLYLDGRIFWDKPPLYFWIECFSFKALGRIDEFAVRLPSVLCALASIGAIFYSARKAVSVKFALITALILATSVEFVIFAKVSILDMLLAFCITISAFSGILTYLPVQIPLACMFLVCSFFIKKQYAFVAYIILITLLSSFMIPRLFNIWYGFGQQDLMKFAGYAKSEGLPLGTYTVWERFSLQYYYGGDVEYFLAGKAYGAKYVNTTKFNNTFNNNLIVIEKRNLKKILITLVISGLTILLTIQLTQFHKAYLEEEKQEITALAQQVSWAVKPILNKGDPKELDKYCSLFMASETKISISSPKGIIAGENLEAPDIMETASISYNKKLKTDILYYSIPLNVNGTRYILSLSTETAGISSIISKFENYIILSIIVVTLLILALAVYFFLKIHIPFNKLQSSAIKIASGDTNTDIFIPDGGILFELSCAINKMAKRLRKQITDMQKLEAFRSEFITNISHEVKTPLTGILSAVEILEEQPESQNPTIMKCLNILSNQSYRLNSLIQDILSLSNIEMRQIKGDKDFKNFNLANSITTSVSICSASKGNIKINTSLENLEYFGNSFLMEQAMTNLIMNAIRYSKSDTIDISLKQKDNLIEIKVRDYGIGIPEEHIPHIFEHFYRVDKARSRKLGGTGLGLAIVKNIVTLHNGSITVESKNGCEFTIKLPN